MTSCVAGPSRAHCTDLAGPKGTGGARRCGQAETGRSGWSADSFVAVPHLARAAMDLAHVCRAARRAEALEFLRRRIDACALHSDTHTLSVGSTYTAYTRGSSPGARRADHLPVAGS